MRELTSSCPHTWCARPDHDRDPDVHEGAPALVAGVDQPGFPAPQATAQVSYRDGDRTPTLFLSAAGVELTAHGVADLIGVLQHRLTLMGAVQPTAVAVTR